MIIKARISKKILFSFMLGITMVQSTMLGSKPDQFAIKKFFANIKDNNINAVRTTLINDPTFANVQFKNKFGRMLSPLTLAIQHAENTDMLELLLSFNADMHQNTPLHEAIYAYRKPEIVQFLIDNGANINDTDSNDNTALDLALNNRFLNRDLIKVLLKNGAIIKYSRNTTEFINDLLAVIRYEAKDEALALGLLINEGRRNTLLTAEMNALLGDPTNKTAP